jgi:hypothetical protein
MLVGAAVVVGILTAQVVQVAQVVVARVGMVRSVPLAQ